MFSAPTKATVAVDLYALQVRNIPNSLFITREVRGVQYVHCVMQKCIMVKLGETKNTVIKYVENM